MNSDLGQPAWADFRIAAHLEALALKTPRPTHTLPADFWGASILLGASAERTGLGLDFTFAPRAEIERSQTGRNTARAGVEFRLGADLLERDQRGTNAPAPSWYFFVGAENEALVWNVADRHALTGVALRDQATVGDLQAGIAWTMKTGGQMSFGMVEREIKFDDATGENDVRRTDRFAALSFTLHH